MTNVIIDSHVHVFSPEQALCVIRLMDEHHVEKALALPAIGLSPFPGANEAALDVVRSFPERIPAEMIGFSTPSDPDRFDGEQAAKEMKACPVSAHSEAVTGAPPPASPPGARAAGR